MDERYRRYFEREVGDLTRFGERRYYPFPLRVESVMNSIPKDGWRPDARFFLANNVIEMVLLPVAVAGPVTENDPNLLESVGVDIKKLVSLAEAIAKDRDRDYVSATSVAMALGRLADSLQTTAFHIWGPETGRERDASAAEE